MSTLYMLRHNIIIIVVLAYNTINMKSIIINFR